MRIFDVDPITNNVTISPEVRQIKWIKDIISRDRGSKGDHDGRKKYLAMKELAYIYFMADSNTIYSNIPENEKQSEIIAALELPEGWKPDEEVLYAIEKYSYYKETVSERTVKEIKRTLEASVDTIQFLREMIEEKIKIIREDKNLDEIEGLVKMFTSTLDMAKAIPNHITELMKLEKKIKEERAESEATIRGSGQVGSYE